MYRWTPEMIRFLTDAAEKTEYYRRLADRLAELLPAEARVCDVGCGLGHLAELLCRSFVEVTAIDRSEAAIDAFRARLGPRPPENLRVLCADALALPREPRFSAMVFCYFGGLPEILRIAVRSCAGTVVVIRRAYPEHRFDLGGHLRVRASGDDLRRSLEGLGVACEAETMELEFGQPLRSREDALRFFRLYQRDPAREIGWEEIAPRLMETGDPVFPWYCPQPKPVVLLRFEAAQIPPQAD